MLGCGVSFLRASEFGSALLPTPCAKLVSKFAAAIMWPLFLDPDGTDSVVGVSRLVSSRLVSLLTFSQLCCFNLAQQDPIYIRCAEQLVGHTAWIGIS